MDATRLESYSRAIAEEFAEDADVLAVLGRLVRSRRGEYEAKIPELGELLALTRDHRRERSRVAREAQERAKHEQYLADVKARPERYLIISALLAEYRAKKAEEQEVWSTAEAAKVTPAAPVTTPNSSRDRSSIRAPDQTLNRTPNEGEATR